MREIIFRAKRKDGRGWVYGDLRQFNDLTYISTNKIRSIDEKVITLEPVLPNTVGQFTGLTDKNGVNIFEGDIGIRYIDKNNPQYIDYWKVIFDENSSGFITVQTKEYNPLFTKVLDVEEKINPFSKRFKEIEIIGNIHETNK